MPIHAAISIYWLLFIVDMTSHVAVHLFRTLSLSLSLVVDDLLVPAPPAALFECCCLVKCVVVTGKQKSCHESGGEFLSNGT